MTVYYIRIDTDKREVKEKRGFFGVWWIASLFTLELTCRDGWPCVDWHMSCVTKKRNEEWHANTKGCPEAEKMMLTK